MRSRILAGTLGKHLFGMSTEEKYDIFISYRRKDGGTHIAKSFALELEKRGYSVFFDGQSISSGRFWDKIQTAINGCTDFLVILTPGSLDRCADGVEDDYVAREINLAMHLGKNILPVMMGDFKFPSPMPECIRGLEDYNAGDFVPPDSPQAIEQTLDYRIKKKFFLSVPANAEQSGNNAKIEQSSQPDLEKELLKKALEVEAKIAESERNLRDLEVAKALAVASSHSTNTETQTLIITEKPPRKGLWFTLTALVVIGVIGISVLSGNDEDSEPIKVSGGKKSPAETVSANGSPIKPTSPRTEITPDNYTGGFPAEILELIKDSPDCFGDFQKLKDMEDKSIEIKIAIRAAKSVGNQESLSREEKRLEQYRSTAQSIRAEIVKRVSGGGSSPKTYITERGDTFAKIAGKLGCTVPALEKANPGIDTRNLKVGQALQIPEKSRIADDSDGDDIPGILAPSSYTVKRGDTLSTIARELKCTGEALKRANPRVDFSNLPLGSTIAIPQSEKTGTISIPSSPSPATVEQSPAHRAVAAVPADKYELISAYDRSGLVYLDGNSRELLAFINALGRRDAALITAILDTFPKIANEVYQDKRSGEKRALLAWACNNRAGNFLISPLIKAGAEVNAVTSRGETALCYAVSSGNLEAVKILLAAGADPNFKTADGKTLTELARRNRAIITALFDAKKSFTGDDLKSLLFEGNPNPSQIRKILASGVNPTDELMYVAVRTENAEILSAFLEAGGNPNARYQNTPIIFYTNYSGDISCAKLLIDYGASTDFAVRISGRTAYRDYLKNRNATELLEYIKTAGTRPVKQAKRL